MIDWLLSQAWFRAALIRRGWGPPPTPAPIAGAPPPPGP